MTGLREIGGGVKDGENCGELRFGQTESTICVECGTF